MKKKISNFIKLSIAASLSFVIALSPVSPVLAEVGGDDRPVITQKEMLEKDDISFFDKDDVLCEPPLLNPDVSTGGGSLITADNNTEFVLKFFTSKGLSLEAAAGFVGNMQAESGVRPNVEEGGRIVDGSYKLRPNVGFGLIQWSDPGRQRSLQDYATDTNRSIIDIGMQLDFAWIELNAGYKSTLAALSSTPDLTPEKAAVIIHGKTPKIKAVINNGTDPNIAIYKLAPEPGYEASNDSANTVLTNRGGHARKVYDIYKEKIQSGSGIGGIGDIKPIFANDCTSPESQLADGSSPSINGAECTATRPVYGASLSGGNGSQMKKAQFEKLYGTVAEARRQQVIVDFFGHKVSVHKVVAPCLAAVRDDIKSSNSTYKVVDMHGLRAAGTGAGAPSPGNGYHDYGVAVDINPKTNPYTTTPKPYDMPPEYIKAFNNRGWSWGGHWNSKKDYMHFEFNGYVVPADNVKQ